MPLAGSSMPSVLARRSSARQCIRTLSHYLEEARVVPHENPDPYTCTLTHPIQTTLLEVPSTKLLSSSPNDVGRHSVAVKASSD